jgi:ubiquinone/menaquinone biosynthesis C-methylase UbiE
VLDLGCGLGAFTALLLEHDYAAVGCDVSEAALRQARARYPAAEFVQSDATLPFADASFDVVWAGEVLEHVQDGLELLAEVQRVLRAGGRLLASTPDHGLARRLRAGVSRRAFEEMFDPRSDHVRFFTTASLRALLLAAGLREVVIRSRRGVLLASAQRLSG